MESPVFSAYLGLMAKEAFLENQGRGARWVGRVFLETLVREDLLGQMETQASWEHLVLLESLVLLVTWDP